MIVLFTGNVDGGIIQLTHMIAVTLKKMGRAVAVFCKENANLKGDLFDIYRYENFVTINCKDRRVIEIAHKIDSLSPDIVLFLDNSPISAEVLLSVSHKSKRVFSIHDVVPHSGSSGSILERIKLWIKARIRKKALIASDKILLYSQSSKQIFGTLYPQCAKKSIYIKLGAHLVTEKESKLPEIHNSDFILFFGRIDGYKGADFLVKEFAEHFADTDMHLVLAGKPLPGFELPPVTSCPNIHIVQRHIMDEEMNWLFQNCSCVVLPYRDASQSGIIPIAYHYGKPVLVSNLPGLTEYVISGQTGEIYNNELDFPAKLKNLYYNAGNMREGVISYYRSELDWEYTLKKMLEQII